jgi:hypothetical protein
MTEPQVHLLKSYSPQLFSGATIGLTGAILRRTDDGNHPAESGGTMAQPEIVLLLGMLDEAYNRAAWHGPNLRGSLRGLKLREAAWRPKAGRHNIWEIAVHAAYWKYAVRRRLVGEKRGSFPLQGSNWFARPLDLEDAAWRADLALLEVEHQTLRKAVMAFPAEELDDVPRGAKSTARRLIAGIALHDVYHAGQIQLIKKLFRSGRTSR